MSYYSDWKCGAISDEDYTVACNMEAARDKALEELDDSEVNCDNYKDGCCILSGQLCSGCE